MTRSPARSIQFRARSRRRYPADCHRRSPRGQPIIPQAFFIKHSHQATTTATNLSLDSPLDLTPRSEVYLGRHDIEPTFETDAARTFTRSLLRDLHTLETMIEAGAFESDIRRIGAEQEVFLIDRGARPACVALDVLNGLDPSVFTTELAQFNLEINLPPTPLGGDCFSAMHEELRRRIGELQASARARDADIVLTGILPTLSKSDLTTENITPADRYHTMNRAMSAMRGGPYRLHIQGADELNLEHDSVMLEACNTSFQVHLQVSPTEFPRLYNAAQACTAPILAAAVNSPLLFGRRLWAETRIALFQQSIDTRRTTPHLRESTPRVRFGEHWIEHSVVELLREDIARIPTIMGSAVVEDSMKAWQSNAIPKLSALQLYNGTVYRWNRPCYGVTNGRPHLRIECRVLPSGPSIIDEIANAAFWIGSVLGTARRYGDLTDALPFDDARANCIAAARRGLNAGFIWLNGQPFSAPDLILDELLPLAAEELTTLGVDPADVERYLGVIEARVTSATTGAQWLQRSLTNMGNNGTRSERMAALTAALVDRQAGGQPCHTWELADIRAAGGWRHNYRRVEQFMTTDLYTVREEELIDLAALIMDWKRIRQIPVEDSSGRLLGLVSYGAVLRSLAAALESNTPEPPTISVAQVMDRNPVTIPPETPTREAIRLMREHQVTALAVVVSDKLVGIVTMDDFLPMADRLLQEIGSTDDTM